MKPKLTPAQVRALKVLVGCDVIYLRAAYRNAKTAERLKTGGYDVLASLVPLGLSDVRPVIREEQGRTLIWSITDVGRAALEEHDNG